MSPLHTVQAEMSLPCRESSERLESRNMNKEMESVGNLASSFVQQFTLPREDTSPESSKYVYSYILAMC